MCYFVSFIMLLFALLFFVLHVTAGKDFWRGFCGILSIVALISCVVFSFVAHWAYGLVSFPVCHAAFYPLFMWEASRSTTIYSSRVSWGVFLKFKWSSYTNYAWSCLFDSSYSFFKRYSYCKIIEIFCHCSIYCCTGFSVPFGSCCHSYIFSFISNFSS